MTPHHGAGEPSASAGLGDAEYAAVFAAVPVALIVIDPQLRMVVANPPYLAAVGLSNSDLAGRYVFDVFPNSPDAEGYDQASALEAIMRRAVATKQPQTAYEMRYDIPVGDHFEHRYWNVTETPVVEDGEVRFLLHYTEDITDLVRERSVRESVAAANEQLQVRVADVQADLLRRAQELEILNERLRRSSQHDRDIAQALQRALLTTLPQLEGLQLAARYQSAPALDEIGGDWYDAVELPNGDTALMIGDVVGHDLNAAAMMGQLRSMMRALCWDRDEPPSAVMRQLDRAIHDLRIPTLATAILAHVELDVAEPAPAARTVRWTNAGHLPPLLVHADGRIERLDGASRRDPLLGVLADAERHDYVAELPAGATLLLYTDGLVETRDRDVDEGIRGLEAALVRNRALELDPMVDTILRETVGHAAEDDVAVLAVRLAAAPARTSDAQLAGTTTQR